MAKGSGGTRGAKNSRSTSGSVETTINKIKVSSTDRSYSLGGGTRAVVYERDSRDYSTAGTPWIIQGAKTIHVEVYNGNSNSYRLSYTYDGEGVLNGIYKTKSAATKAMKEDLKYRFAK